MVSRKRLRVSILRRALPGASGRRPHPISKADCDITGGIVIEIASMEFKRGGGPQWVVPKLR